MTRLASGGAVRLKRAMTRSGLPRSSSTSPGSTWTSDASARQLGCEPPSAVSAPGVRWPGDHADAGTAGMPRAPAWQMRSSQVGTVSSQSCERRCSRASRTTVDWRYPSRPPARSSLDLVDGGQQLGAQLGMPGLDPAGHPSGIAGRPQRRHRAGDAGQGREERQRRRQPGRAGSVASEAGRQCGDGPAAQGQHEPASRQAAPEPQAAGTAARPVPMPAAVSRS